MNSHRLAVVLSALLFATIVGFFAFNAGIAHGVAVSGKMPATVAAPPAYAPPYAYPYPYYYGWHAPWGFGIFFFFVLWCLVIRGLFWRGGWHRHGCGNYQQRFDEWHQQSHERMKEV